MHLGPGMGVSCPLRAYVTGVSLVLRRLLPALVALGILLAACGTPAAPVLTDPDEILAQGLEATANLNSFHLQLSLDGRVTDPTSGSTFPLSGTSVEGDFDLENQRIAATFSAMGFSGDVRLVDGASYLKMSLTGPQWIKSEVAADASGDPMDALRDPAAAIAELRTFLERDGVETVLEADGSCDDRPCYHVVLTLSPELLDEAAAEQGQSQTVPSEVLPDGLEVDLFFDKEKRHLARLGLDLAGSEIGELSATLAISKVDEPVDVEAPPADEVTEGGGLPFP